MPMGGEKRREKKKTSYLLLGTRDCLERKREHRNVSLDMHQHSPSMGIHTHPLPALFCSGGP